MARRFRRKRLNGGSSEQSTKRSYKKRIHISLHKRGSKKAGEKRVKHRRKANGVVYQEMPRLSVDADEKWIIVELSEDVKLEEKYEVILGRLQEILGDPQNYFIPVYSERIGDKSACVVLFEGYIFVKSTVDNEEKSKLLKDEHIKGPLLTAHAFNYTDGMKVNSWRDNLQKKIKEMIPTKGQKVMPKVGTFKNLEGKVVSVDKKKLIAQVIFKRSSRIVKAPISIINLETVSFI